MVSLDIYLNETTRHADVILPGPSPLEDMHYDVPFPQLSWRNHARYSPPCSRTAPGQPAEWQTLLRLAAIAQGGGAPADVQALDDALFEEELRKLFGDAAPAVVAGHAGPARARTVCWTWPCAPAPMATSSARSPRPDLAGCMGQRTRRHRPGAPATPPARAAAHAQWQGGAGAAVAAGRPEARAGARPGYRPAPDPLVIIGRRDVRSNNSWMHNLPVLAKGPFRCTALVHPTTPQRLGLQTVADRHAAQRPAQHHRPGGSERRAMMPGVVSLPHGWGHDLPGARLRVAAERPGANLNALFDDQLRDPLSGNAVLSGVAISMEAA
jgi:anaerobic selenocysteine-containing dehydrogenase